MIQRERQITYYLDQVQTGPIILHEDGSVGALKERKISRKVEVPGRRPERPRQAMRTEHMLAETAIKSSMRDYIGSREKPEPLASYGRDYSWELADFPDDVQDEYRHWVDTPRFSIDGLRAAAIDLQATEHELVESMIPCRYCSVDPSYACRASGWDREFYRYPGMDLVVEDQHYIVPIDIARVATMNPEAIDYEVEFYANPRDNTLQATRWLTFHVDAIPSAYIDERMEGLVTLDDSDKVSGDIKVPVAHWSENDQKPSYRHSSDAPLEDNPASAGTADYIKALQETLALRASDRKERHDYDAMYAQLTRSLGARGMNLMYEFKYMGMGESGVIMAGKKPVDGLSTYDQIHELYLGSPIDARDGVMTALERMQEFTNL